MALALAIEKRVRSIADKELIVQATPSGNYANSGTTGDTVNLTACTNPNNETDALFGYPGDITDWEVVSSPAGFLGVLVKGGTLATWGLRVFENAAGAGALAELANGAYPAGVTAGVFVLRFRGPKLRL